MVLGRADDTMNLGGIKVSIKHKFLFLFLENLIFHFKCLIQTSSVEIEMVCNRADENILETAAVAIKIAGNGPENLVILVVLKNNSLKYEPSVLRSKFEKAIRENLNPLFKVSIIIFQNSLLIFLCFFMICPHWVFLSRLTM